MKPLNEMKFTQVLPLNTIEYQVFCNFDGTLVEVANAPHKIYVNEYLPCLLNDLNKKCQFCLVTGRTLDDLQSYLPIEDLDVLGCYGAQYSPKGLNANARVEIHPILQEITVKLGEVLFAYPGIFIEEKPYSIAIHYQNFKGNTQQLKQQLDRICCDYRHDINLLPRKKVYEYCLKSMNKGSAIRTYINKVKDDNGLPKKVLNVFVGDDITDEDGFKEINKHNGISIRVGFLKKSAAHYYVKDIYDVHALLAYISQSSATHFL